MYRQATRQEKSADKYSGFSVTAGISACDKKKTKVIYTGLVLYRFLMRKAV